MGKAVVDRVGRRYGRLVVLSRAVRPAASTVTDARWLCRCDCGQTCVVIAGNLQTGTSTSCGCGKVEATRRRNFRHGDGKKAEQAPEYTAWLNMRYRCQPDCRDRALYFDRGITVCAEWDVADGGYQVFLAHIGRRPTAKHSIDRIDNDRGYEPGNVRWALPVEQVSNRRVTVRGDINGLNLPLTEAIRRFGVVEAAHARTRIQRGWSFADAVLTPVEAAA